MRQSKPALLVVLAFAAAASVQAQSRYDQYGPAVEVTIGDLVRTPAAYSGRPVRTRGFLELDNSSGMGTSGRVFRLRDSFSYSIIVLPVPELSQEFESESSTYLGREMEIVGLFEETNATTSTAPMTQAAGYVTFWKFTIVPDRNEERLSKARKISIEELAARPERFQGRTIRVVGQFRGANLFADLPAKSQRKRGDWVLQEGERAIWVTGKKPKGDGWQLDPSLKRDTGKWLEVTGKIEAKGDVAYMHAERLLLTTAPLAPPVKAEATPAPPERPRRPPIVVFALPLDGDVEVPGDSRFVVQFSNDMDEASFQGRVQLRYRNAPRAGIRPLDSVSFSYEPGRRALTVEPGDRLGRGTDLELRLLPGIKDIEGLELTPRRGEIEGGVVDVLRYHVGS
jgi:hypothetical protein